MDTATSSFLYRYMDTATSSFLERYINTGQVGLGDQGFSSLLEIYFVSFLTLKGFLVYDMY